MIWQTCTEVDEILFQVDPSSSTLLSLSEIRLEYDLLRVFLQNHCCACVGVGRLKLKL